MNGMTNGSMNGTTNGYIHGETDDQVLADTTRFDPLPDVKSILVTGGNGFMYVLPPRSMMLILCDAACLRTPTQF